MNDQKDALSYHSRRSIDELVSASTSGDPAAAKVHKELALLHLERFVGIMTSASRAIELLSFVDRRHRQP